MPKSETKIFLGIDPGLATTGWGVIKKVNKKIEVIDWGIIKTNKTTEFPKRLVQISQDIQKLIKEYQPDKASVEELFFCNNAKTAFLVGQARGVVMMELAKKKIPITELTPLQVKQSISGYGKADKKQVQQMVKAVLKLKVIPKPDDAADALALAIAIS